MKKNEIRTMCLVALNLLLLYFFVWKNFVSLQEHKEQEKKYQEERESLDTELIEKQQRKRILETRREERAVGEIAEKKIAFPHSIVLEELLWRSIEKYRLSIQMFSRMQWEEEAGRQVLILPIEIVGEQRNILLFLQEMEERLEYVRFLGQYVKWERKAQGRALFRANLRCYVEKRGEFHFPKREQHRKNYVRRRGEDGREEEDIL